MECSGVFSTQSVEVRLAVSGEQPLFTRGLPMFVLSPQYFMSLPLGSSTIVELLFMSKVSFRDTDKIVKKIRVGLKVGWRWCDKFWLSWKRPSFEVYFSCPFDILLGVTYANMLVVNKWPLTRAHHLNASVGYGGLEAHLSSIRYPFTVLNVGVYPRAPVCNRG